MTITFTGATASNTTISAVSSIAGLLVGQAIAGAGIPGGAVIAWISGTAVTLSVAATATASGVSFTVTVVGFTAVTARRIMDASGNILIAGRVTFFPVNTFGKPISAIAGGGGGMIQQAGVVFLVAYGAITTDLYGGSPRIADTALTTPINICYRIIVTDGAGAEVQGPGYALQQPSGATFNLDTAPPNQPMQGIIYIGPAGANGAPGPPGGFNLRGAWAAYTAYAIGDLLTEAGASYTPSTAFTSGSTFSSADLTLVTSSSIVMVDGGTGLPVTVTVFNGALDY